MEVCEICGGNAFKPKYIFVEGSQMLVCEKCSSHGQVVKGPSNRSMVYKRPRWKKEEIVFDVASDYDKLVHQKRESLGIKQEDLGKKINEPASLIAKIESGKIVPSEKVARKLEKALGLILLEQSKQESFEHTSSKKEEFTLGDLVKIKKRKV